MTTFLNVCCRNKYIRWRFLLRRLVEVIFLSAVLAGISQQWIMPTVQNTFKVRLGTMGPRE